MKVGELGEFGLIDLLAALVSEATPDVVHVEGERPRLHVGIGDDAAAWGSSRRTLELLTTDTLVSGVHFLPGKIGWKELGWKAMAVNYSDVAAMGGTPLFSVVTLGLPRQTEVDDVLDMYRGMMSLCKEYGGAIVGGDVVSSPVTFVTVSLTGTCDAPPMVRSSARVAEQVAVTGTLGSSGGGLRLHLGDETMDAELVGYLKQAHNRPRPRLSEGLRLRRGGVRTALDISDGLVGDLGKLCRSSEVGAIVYAGLVPVDQRLKRAYPQEWLDLALSGGEDYELLFTAPREIMEEVGSQIEDVTVIGEIVERETPSVDVRDEKGNSIPVGKGGWDHFG